MRRHAIIRGSATWAPIGLFVALLPALPRTAAAQFAQINLVSDGFVPAAITDSNLVNPWGISFRPGSPFWVSDNGTGVTTLYSVNGATNAVSKIGLTVTIPGVFPNAGNPTGQVANPNGGFNGDLFLFASEDGTISGWRPSLGTTAEVLQAASTINVYKGLAAAAIGGHSYLYAANFRAGTIDVLKGDAGAPDLTGTFSDPSIPTGFAPFNVQVLNGKVYVTYAKQNGDKHDDVSGPGNGFVNAFDLQGKLLSRIGSAGTLDSPWGLAIAPASFGSFAGDLLVGNFGNGHIGAFDPDKDPFHGELFDISGTPVAIEGLWALTVGGSGGDGSPNKLYFTAGSGGEAHGLFGVLAVPEPSAWALLACGVIPAAMVYRRRKR